MKNTPKADFDQSSRAKETVSSQIKNLSDPTLKDWERVYTSILKSAIAHKDTNPDFFWAASEMVTPQVDIRTILYGQKVAGFQDIVTSKGELGRGARKFVAAMDASFNAGANDLPKDLQSDIAHLLAHHRVQNATAHSAPTPASREYAVA